MNVFRKGNKCYKYIFRKCVTVRGRRICAKKGKSLRIPIEVPCNCLK